MSELENGDYVEATYKGSKYYGKLSRIDLYWKDGTVTMAPGVSMILPLKAMTKLEEGAGNGTYSI